MLVRVAALLVGDVAAAEDVVQDSFLAMHRAWWRLRVTSKALPYLRRAVINRSRSVLRHRAVADRHLPLLAPHLPSAEDGALAGMERSSVPAALRARPIRQREVVVLRYYADLSETQIAAAMGISKGAVKTHAARLGTPSGHYLANYPRPGAIPRRAIRYLPSPVHPVGASRTRRTIRSETMLACSKACRATERSRCTRARSGKAASTARPVHHAQRPQRRHPSQPGDRPQRRSATPAPPQFRWWSEAGSNCRPPLQEQGSPSRRGHPRRFAWSAAPRGLGRARPVFGVAASISGTAWRCCLRAVDKSAADHAEQAC